MFNEQQFRLEHRLDEVVLIDGITFKPREYRTKSELGAPIAGDYGLKAICYVCSKVLEENQWYLRALPVDNDETVRMVLYMKNYFAHHESCTEKLQERIRTTVEMERKK